MQREARDEIDRPAPADLEPHQPDGCRWRHASLVADAHRNIP